MLSRSSVLEGCFGNTVEGVYGARAPGVPGLASCCAYCRGRRAMSTRSLGFGRGDYSLAANGEARARHASPPWSGFEPAARAHTRALAAGDLKSRSIPLGRP